MEASRLCRWERAPDRPCRSHPAQSIHGPRQRHRHSYRCIDRTQTESQKRIPAVSLICTKRGAAAANLDLACLGRSTRFVRLTLAALDATDFSPTVTECIVNATDFSVAHDIDNLLIYLSAADAMGDSGGIFGVSIYRLYESVFARAMKLHRFTTRYRRDARRDALLSCSRRNQKFDAMNQPLKYQLRRSASCRHRGCS